MNTYNIVTLANSPYFKFLTILINSALDKCNFDNIDTFYIVDTGLEPQQIEWIKNKHPKLTILPTKLTTKFEGGPWGHDWLLNVKNKSSFLYQLHINTDSPILMIDSDMMFVNDPVILLKNDADLLLCPRPGAPLITWGDMPAQLYIGSFVFILNPRNVTPFLYDWLTEVRTTSIMPPESPSLAKVVNLYKEKINIMHIEESIVNVLYTHQLTEDSIIVHFKGSDLINDLTHQYNKRINEKGWSEYTNKYLESNV